MVQLYKEDWTILHMLHMLGCQAIALPSSEQIVVDFYLPFLFLDDKHVHDEQVYYKWPPCPCQYNYLFKNSSSCL